MNLREQAEDIADVIREVSAMMGVPMLEREIRTMGQRLAKHHSIELFRILRALPEGKFFPSAYELEQRVRQALGKEPLKGGLTEELIERHTIEIKKSGNIEAAEKGAAFLKGVLERTRIPANPPEPQKQDGIYAPIDPLGALSEESGESLEADLLAEAGVDILDAELEL